MLLYITSFIIFIVLILSLFYKTHLPLWLKLGGSFIILVISLKYEIYQFLGGAFFAPYLPRTFLIVMEGLYGSLLMLFFLVLLFDLYLAGNWLLARAGIPVPSHIPRGWIKICLCILSLCLGSFGTWQAIKVPDVKKVILNIPNLPNALSGLNIVQLSDLHIGPILKGEWLSQVVKKANALEPDLIVLTGDFVDGYVSEIQKELEPLANLKAKYGIFGISGNHEYYWNIDEWREALKNLGVTFLENSHKSLEIHGEKFVIAGLSDLAALRFGKEGPNLEKALENAPNAVKLLLMHQPRDAVSNLKKVNLQLSGHTHGGLMFFLQPLVARFNNGFVSGFYQLDAGGLYVHPGTGLWNGFSNRLGVPAEITNIILHPHK